MQQWKTRLEWPIFVCHRDAQSVVDTLKTAAAHILINRDGPALHPGPRRYSLSWIRDGALMAAALLRVGCTDESRDFIRWYAGYQTAEGNLPDCAGRDGTEWLPEYDCWGEFIFAIMDYYRFSGDRAFLVELWPAVLKSVDYMEALRNQRLTPEYQTPEKRACYGLLPESMSHEGYMAHPVHAYWDDFWALRGLKDAAAMAVILDDSAQAPRLAALRDAFGDTLYASLDTILRDRQLDFIPGSVEFADFDPAATAIALTTVDELHRLPRSPSSRCSTNTWPAFASACGATFPGTITALTKSASSARWCGSVKGNVSRNCWRSFWPTGGFRPGINGPKSRGATPRPQLHRRYAARWIGAEYILSIRSLFAYEREADQALVIAAGIAEDWLNDAGEVVVKDLPTYSAGSVTPCVGRIPLPCG